ncbi:DUF1223 domain-containing protein [Paludibaculum fermentans]|uniref:DUF1223 domain-containing protein n=1 Tax=Paludibaculum fermentans TaxID=1473598 RepID=UPI003EBF5390
MKLGYRAVCTAAAAVSLVCTAAISSDTRPTAPVLVELFTSEGCSSCPPADAILARLDQEKTVSGVPVIVLSEHVDYWNGIGWKDPFSSAQFSARQQAYSQSFRLESVFTPQMVVDGREQFVGSDTAALNRSLDKASREAKAELRIVKAARNGSEAEIEVEAGPGSLNSKTDLNVWVALARDRESVAVRNGENSGRNLTHAAVVRTLVNAGTMRRGGGFHKTVRVPLDSKLTGIRAVVFLQPAGAGPVAAVAQRTLADSSRSLQP